MTELRRTIATCALLRQPVDVTPVWMMRQAGRYLPEYKATRPRPVISCRCARTRSWPVRGYAAAAAAYALDAAILFSDILTIPDAMRRPVL